MKTHTIGERLVLAWSKYKNSPSIETKQKYIKLLFQKATPLCVALVGLDNGASIANLCVSKVLSSKFDPEGGATIATWFHKIVVHTCIDEQRKFNRRKALKNKVSEALTNRVYEVEDKYIAHLLYDEIHNKLEKEEKLFLEGKLIGLSGTELSDIFPGRNPAHVWQKLKIKIRGLIDVRK